MCQCECPADLVTNIRIKRETTCQDILIILVTVLRCNQWFIIVNTGVISFYTALREPRNDGLKTNTNKYKSEMGCHYATILWMRKQYIKWSSNALLGWSLWRIVWSFSIRMTRYLDLREMVVDWNFSVKYGNYLLDEIYPVAYNNLSSTVM